MANFTNKKQKINKAVIILNNSEAELRMIAALREKAGK